MPNVAVTNLTSGEISPTMLGRPDVGRYGNGCQRLENFLQTTTGMWSYRPGFRLMGFPKHANRRCILRRFQFSNEQGYVLELGHLYMRVWHSSGQVLSGGGGSPFEIATLFDESELSSVGFTQSNDWLLITHISRGVFVISRSAHDSWSIAPFPPGDGPYGPVNADPAKTVTLDALSGTIECAWTGVAPFAAGDEGRLIRVQDGADWRWLIIQTVDTASTVHANLVGPALTTLTIGTPTPDWRLGLYSNRLGWPLAARIHEQRLILAGAAVAPDRIDGSVIGSYDNFTPGTDDDSAVSFRLGQDGVNRVTDFASAYDLVAFTSASKHRVAGDSTGATITPTALWQKPISPGGARHIEPVPVGNAIVYVDVDGLNIQSISYDIRYEGYGDDNLTVLADHMAYLEDGSRGFQALVYQPTPLANLWTIRGNDELAGCIYNPKEQVLGWHRHPMGMPVNMPGTAAYVESIETIRGPAHHELWAVVRRHLPSGIIRTIERMDRAGQWNAPPESRLHLDCGLSLRNTPLVTLTVGAATGNGVSFSIGSGSWTSDHVGRFIKYRYVSGRNRRGGPVYRTAIAQIASIVNTTTVTADILVPFPAAGTIAAGAWGLTVNRITGLEHFAGLDIVVVSDGRVLPPKTVDQAGGIDLDVPGWEVHAGLPYEGWVIPMPVDPGPSPAVGSGRESRIDRLLLRLLNSIGGEVAALPQTEEEPLRWDPLIPYTQGTAGPQAPPQPVSKDHDFHTGGSWTKRAEVAIRQIQPLPFNCSLLIQHAYAPWVQP